MNCLVTGVAGFVGSSIADALLSKGYKVKGIDCFLDYYPKAIKDRNIKAALKNPNFEFYSESLLKIDWSQLLKGVNWIFHQAGQAGVRASWGDYFSTYVDNNILATQKLLEAVRENLSASGSVEKVVYASSSSIYGNAESFPTQESVVPKPVSPYGVTKLAAEHLTTLYASQYGLPTVSLRYFTVFGPRQRPDMAFNKFIKAALLGNELTIYGDGTQSRDFTYISDIVAANILAAEKGSNGAVYNLGGGTQATVNQVLDIIRAEVGELKVKYQERQIGDASHTSADTKLARLELGFNPKISLLEGIKNEIQWMRGEISENSPGAA